MTHETKTNPWAGFARGWFMLMFSEELQPGDVVPMKRFAQELVLFRTESAGCVLPTHGRASRTRRQDCR